MFFIRKIFFSSLKLQRFPQGFESLNKMFEMAYLLVIKSVHADVYLHTLTHIYKVVYESCKQPHIIFVCVCAWVEAHLYVFYFVQRWVMLL